MPKKSVEPDHQFSQKSNRLVKTGKLRQRETYARLVQNLGKLKQVQGCPSANHAEAVGMAADSLANQPPGGLSRFLLGLAHIFFEPLEYQFGKVRPIEDYWQMLISFIDAADRNFAQAILAGGYEQSFRWLAFGHVQRLSVIYSKEPEAIKVVEIYEDSSGKLTPVAVCNDGLSFVIPNDYFNEAPEVYFPGEHFTLPMHPDDVEQIENQSKIILVPDSLESLKPRPSELLRHTVLVNVGLPDDMETVAQRIKANPLPQLLAQLRQR